MRFIYHATILVVLILFNDKAVAQEETDPSPVNSISTIVQDSSASNLIDSLGIFDRSEFLNLLYTFVFFILSFIIIIYLKQPLQRLSDRKMDHPRILKQFIPMFLTVCWIVVFYIIINDILKLSFSYTLVILAIAGFAIALALQDTLKDVIAGFILPFEDHIATGYKIQIGNIFGEIVRIGLREIELKQPDGNIAIIPTSRLLNETAEKVYIEKENCPVHINFYLPLLSDLDRCREIAHKSSIISPYLFLNKPVTVRFSNELVNDQTIIKMSIKAFLLKIEFQPLFVSEITESVVKELIHATIISDAS